MYICGKTHVGDDKVSITESFYVNIDPEIDVEQKCTLSKAYLSKVSLKTL